MRGFGLWLIILSLPLFAALGHDGYMAYHNPQSLDFSKPLPLSDLGWIWQRRAFDSWHWAHEMVDPKIWEKFVRPVLNQKAVFVAAVPPVLLLVVASLLKLFGIGPYAGQGLLSGRSAGRKRYASDTSTQGPKIRYKRR